MRGLRRAGAPLRLALARARTAPGRWALGAAGIALAVAALGIAVGGGGVAGERAARDLVRGLPAQERTARVTWSGGLPPGIERRGRAALTALTPGAQTGSVLLLPTGFTSPGRSAGTSAQLAAVTPLARWAQLSAGRWPRTCIPTRCEVLALGGPGAPRELVRGDLRVVTVGTGTLRSPVPLGFVPRRPVPGQLAEGRPQPLLVGADPAALERAAALTGVFRTHAWTAPLAAAVPSWRLDGLRTRIVRAGTALRARDESFALAAPTEALAAARDRAHEARRRVGLVGAGAAALLAAFVLVAGSALRPGLAREGERLERLGARGWQRGALAVAECGGAAGLGCAAGAALAVAVTAVRARSAGLDATGLLRHTLVTTGGLLGLVACAAAATAVLTLAVALPAVAARRLADALALAALAALALALARGGVTPDDPGDPLPLLLPPLACGLAGLVVARTAAPGLRGLERLSRRAPLPARLAALDLARAPGRPALTVAAVAVGAGLACFAAAYGATLDRGALDQAAYAVPLDVTVQEGPAFVPPLAVASTARWRTLTAGGRVLPVQRASVTVPRGARRLELPLLGVPAAALPQLRGWREADASVPRATLAARLRPGPRTAPVGPLVTAGVGSLAVRARSGGSALDLTAHLVGPDGSDLALPLGTATATPRTLRAALPARATGRRLVALELALPDALLATEGHQEAESATSRDAIAGTLALSGLEVGGRPVPLRAWVGRGPAGAPRTTRGTTRLTYRFDAPGRALLRPAQPTDGTVLRVLTDPATARGTLHGGLLPVSVGGVAVRARVVGTVRRLPTVAPDADGFVLADEAALRTALSADAPGSGRPDELWLGVAPGGPERRLRAALARGPFDALAVRSRRAIARGLREDPLARELTRTLGLAALAALVTAAAAVVLSGALALRDDAAALEDLEALGVAPGTLRADVRLRAALVTGFGLVAGIALGVALTGLVVGAVDLTPAGTAPLPPLVPVLPWGTWLLGGLGLAALVALGSALVTRRAFGPDLPAGDGR